VGPRSFSFCLSKTTKRKMRSRSDWHNPAVLSPQLLLPWPGGGGVAIIKWNSGARGADQPRRYPKPKPSLRGCPKPKPFVLPLTIAGMVRWKCNASLPRRRQHGVLCVSRENRRCSTWQGRHIPRVDSPAATWRVVCITREPEVFHLRKEDIFLE
jgi:hypothetical protein